ncbi:hypothetical protein M3Y98_00827000 [Aphelenchoides besseyi]|nr:hypothetical protein M3Y98_00827000 [Aphelenchoides besseyi]
MPFVQISAVTRYGLEHVNVFMSVTPQSNAFSIGLDEENCRIYSAPGGNEKRYITHSSTNNYCVEFGSLEELFNVNNQLLVVGRLENLRLSFYLDDRTRRVRGND